MSCKEIMKLEGYKFAEIIDMKREDFDKALSMSEMNVGTLESLRKLLSLHYEQMQVQVNALTELVVSEDTCDADKEQALSTIKQMYLIMFSMEYKASAIYSKVQKLQEQLS